MTELPVEKAQELRKKYTPHPQRGSAAAILETLEEVGPLQFEEGELDSLLKDIETMRQMDIQESD